MFKDKDVQSLIAQLKRNLSTELGLARFHWDRGEHDKSKHYEQQAARTEREIAQWERDIALEAAG